MNDCEELVRPQYRPVHAEVLETDKMERADGQLQINLSISNYCGEDIYVITRNGIVYTLSTKGANLKPRGVYFTTTVIADKSVKINQVDSFSAQVSEAQLHGRSLLASIGTIDNWCQLIEMRNLAFISKEDINKSGRAIYINELDLVIAFSNAMPNPDHPFMNPLTMVSPLESTDYIGMELIDNEDAIGPIYVNFTNEPIRLVPRKSSIKPSGLYISDPGPAKLGPENMPNSQRRTYYSPDRLTSSENRSGLLQFIFNNYEDAKSYGSAIAERERQLKLEMHEMKLDAARAAQDLAEAKAKFDKEKEERDRLADIDKQELDRLNRELEFRRNMESMDRKDYYERRSFDRKDSSEWLKFAPAVITLVASLIPLLKG